MKPFLRKYLGFIIAGLMLAAGIICTLVVYLNDPIGNDRVVLEVPGDKEIQLEAGRYAIFYEYTEHKSQYGPIQMTSYRKDTSWLGLVEIRIVDPSNKEEISKAEDSSMTYTIDDMKGESLYSFTVPQKNRYRIQTLLKDTEMDKSMRLTLMPDFSKQLFGLFRTLGIFVLISIAIALLGLFQFLREVKRIKNGHGTM